jgi:hypothetical protein
MTFIKEHLSTILLSIGGAIAWFRREIKEYFKGKSEDENNTLNNLDKIFLLYEKLINDLEVRFAKQIAEKEQEILELKAEIQALRLRIISLEKIQ